MRPFPKTVSILIIIVFLFFILLETNNKVIPSGDQMKKISGGIENVTKTRLQYIAVGDSYTSGTGAQPEESWPSLLAEDLTKAGIPVELAANPSRAGFTTADALEKELPLLPERADLATLLIGANDWVQGGGPEIFRKNLRLLIDDLHRRVPKGRLFLITIPDLSSSPFGNFFSGGRNVSGGIQEFNRIISEEAEARNLTIIDIFSVRLKPHQYADGIHPNAEGYAVWEKTIFEGIRPFL